MHRSCALIQMGWLSSVLSFASASDSMAERDVLGFLESVSVSMAQLSQGDSTFA